MEWIRRDNDIPSIPTLYTIFLKNLALHVLCTLYSIKNKPTPAHQTSSFHPYKPECPNPFFFGGGFEYSICPAVHERGGKIFFYFLN